MSGLCPNLSLPQLDAAACNGSSDARIVNVSSGVGSLTTNADPAYPYHAFFGPIYPASKAALNAMTLALMIELESTDIKVNLVSPGFTKTNLNGYVACCQPTTATCW